VADLTEEVPYPAGARVVEEGLPGEALFVILEGEAQVTRRGRTLARLRPGDVFGEISVLDGGPRTATVVASTPLLVLRLYRRELTKLLQREPQIASRLLKELARRLRSSERAGNW
jgi:CRP-like cAMP-binding protein